MRVVQVRISRPAFADTLGVMRSWLDRHNRPLVRFETESEGDTIVVTLYFGDDAFGAAFRDEFGGADCD